MANTEQPGGTRSDHHSDVEREGLFGPPAVRFEPPEVASDPVEPGPPVAVAAASGPASYSSALGPYLRSWLAQVRGGQSGILPVIGGLILITIIFQSLNSHFLSSGNLVNLLVQGAVYMLLAVGEVFVLLLGEIDLSIGYVGGVGAVIMAELLKPSHGWPWWAAVIAALAVTTAIGGLQGLIITQIGLPSFVVTLAGQLGWLGVLLTILGSGGVVPINSSVINDITSGTLNNLASWAVMLAAVAAFAAWTWWRDHSRRTSGLVAPPLAITAAKVTAALVAGVAVVLICNTNRGTQFATIRGLPWVLILVIAVLAAWTLLLGRTRFGRYLYAIGGNAEAARRAGIRIKWTKTRAFMLAGLTSGLAGIVYASRLHSVSTSFEGNQLVLYAIAAAVIGGTSLFGGRGKAIHGIIGGLVIAAIANGMGLQGYSAQAQYMVTALVLLVAVIIDALAHRGQTTR